MVSQKSVGKLDLSERPSDRRLSSDYLRLIEIAESLPQNQSGSDKTWVEKQLQDAREHFRRAHRVR